VHIEGLIKIGGWLTPIPCKNAAGGLSWRRPKSAEATVMMVGLIAVATLTRLAIDPFVFGAQFHTFFLAVIGSTVLGGICIGLLSLILSMLSAWYFFVRTQYSFVLAEGEAYSLILFVVIASAIVLFIGSLQAALAEEIAIKTRAETVEMFVRGLQHRIRNNLQHIQAMLESYASTVSEGEAKQRITTIISRLTTMTHMYDHLLGVGLDGTVKFADYLRTLCIRLSELQSGLHDQVNLVCTTAPTQLDLDKVTSLGLVVAKLVTNSYSHAFPIGGAAQ
jgi:signal transduction histidine kinase